MEDISTSIRNKLEKGREDAFLSQQLARIVTDLDIPFDLEQARAERFDPKEVEDLFRELEFRSLFNRLEKLTADHQSGTMAGGDQLSFLTEPAELKRIDVTVIDSEESLNELVSRLRKAEQISFDTETTSTDQMRAELVGISLAIDSDRGYYIPVGHRINSARQLPKEV